MEFQELELEDAWGWVTDRALPGLPVEGSSVEVADLEEKQFFCLAQQNGKFRLYSRQGVAVTDGQYFKTRSGRVEKVILAHPGSDFPFEGHHSGLRYMADGRHTRFVGDFSHTPYDLVARARDVDVEKYESWHACYPTRAAYQDMDKRLQDSLLSGGLLGDRPDLYVEDLVRQLLESASTICTADPALERCCTAFLEQRRLATPDPEQIVVKSVESYTELQHSTLDRKVALALVACLAIIGFLSTVLDLELVLAEPAIFRDLARVLSKGIYSFAAPYDGLLRVGVQMSCWAAILSLPALSGHFKERHQKLEEKLCVKVSRGM